MRNRAKDIVEFLNEDYKFMAKDKNGKTHFFKERPELLPIRGRWKGVKEEPIICVIDVDWGELNWKKCILEKMPKDYKKEEEKIVNIFHFHLGIDRNKIHLVSDIYEDLGADSLDAVELAMALEEAYNIIIPDEDAIKFKTIKDVIDYIMQNK